MVARMVAAERELENELRASARAALGAAATEVEIDTYANKMYHGPENVENWEETAAERREREREKRGSWLAVRQETMRRRRR